MAKSRTKKPLPPVEQNSAEQSTLQGSVGEDSSAEESRGVVWLGSAARESKWVLEQLRAQYPTLVLNSTELREAFAGQLRPSHVLIPAANRFEDLSAADQWVQRKWPKAKRAMLLGEWWQGSYRTHPLPESIDRFYWYQWWDAIVPWLDDSLDRRFESAPWAERYRRAVRSRVLLPAEGSSRLVSVTLVAGEMRDVWSAMLKPMGWIPIFRRIGAELPDCEFQASIIDLSLSRFGESDQSEIADWKEEIALMRRILGSGVVLVRMSFPNWSTWKLLEEFGADVMVSGMVGWEGIFRKCLADRRLYA